jgi:protein SCO1/2
LSLALLSTCIAVRPCPVCGADSKIPRELQKVGFDQHLDQQVPLDLPFVDDGGNQVKLGAYFGEKPVVLVLAYYRCPMSCTQVLNGLVQGMRNMPFTVGKEFNVVTVSFDPRETAELAAEKKETYVTSYGRAGAAAGWHFLTGKPPSIDKLTSAVGFRYVYDAKYDQFIHTSGIMVLTPQGKISRYFYGISFPGRDLRLGLVEASAGKIGSRVDEILLYCFHYDPQSGKYTGSILNVIRVGGILTVAGLVGMVWFLLRTERHKSDVASDPMTVVARPSSGGPPGDAL